MIKLAMELDMADNNVALPFQTELDNAKPDGEVTEVL